MQEVRQVVAEETVRGRERLTRERVLRAAVAVVDREGLAALSMRRVADELGVEAMALYRYTPSKDDLLDGMVETLFLDAEEPLTRADEVTAGAGRVTAGADGAAAEEAGVIAWREGLEQQALAIYRMALAHPRVVPLVATRPLSVPFARRPRAVLRCHERVLALLRGSGMDDERALTLYRRFLSWVLGYIVIELRQTVDAPDETDPAFRLGLHRLPPAEFPQLRELGPALAQSGGERQLLAGLAALLTAPDGDHGQKVDHRID
ncbi:TetR/AcrR family transcriptional regulator [Streptomyces sp. NPDC002328]|uniref:TetR/AcrR family transcriptional regulator n=1 Tax=Streptomyces sp. NPDC002328 TaxID=3364642 RepID=UPI00367490F0